MNIIIVGHDGSDTAQRAAVEAAGLAQATGAEFHLLRVLDDDGLRQGMTTADNHAAAVQSAKEAASRLLFSEEAQFSKLLAGLTIRTEVTSGPAAAGIVSYAENVGADLIVLGNRRVQGLSRVLGSVALDVLRHAPCSVYVAHTN